MKKPTITFYPNEKKRSLKNKEIPIYLRIYANGKKTEARLDVSLSSDELCYWNGFTQRLERPNNALNSRLEAISFEFNGLPYTQKERYYSMTADEIKSIILRDPNSIPAVRMNAIDYIENHFKAIVMPSNNISFGTKKNYRKTINHFKHFLKFRKKEKMTLVEINKQVALEFYDYLNQDIPEINKKAIKEVSASSLIRILRTIFNRAIEYEQIVRNPFNNLPLKFHSPKKAYLEISEVKLLINADLSENRKLEVYRDIFLFGVYTGLAYSDIYNLLKTQITPLNEHLILNNNRIKTGIDYKQILVKQAVDIIEKYKNTPEAQITGKVFPPRHLNNVNDYLKVIQSISGIHKPLSTHIARHTCSQLLRNISSINTEVINTMLGWSNRRLLGASHAYRITTNEMLLDAKTKYENFLNHSL